MVSESMLSVKLLCECCVGLLMPSGCMVVGGQWCDDIQSSCAPECVPVGGLDSICRSFCPCFVVPRRKGSCWFAKYCILGMHGGIFPGEEIVSEWAM